MKVNVTNASSGYSVTYDLFAAYTPLYTLYAISPTNYDWIYAGELTVEYSQTNDASGVISYDLINIDTTLDYIKYFLVAKNFYNSGGSLQPEEGAGVSTPFNTLSYDVSAGTEGTIKLSGKQTQRYEKVFKVYKETLETKYGSGNAAGQYKVKVRRTTEESKSSKSISNLYFSLFREIQDQTLSYPNIAHVAFKIQATDQLSGGFPNLSFLMNGKRIYVWNVTLNKWTVKSSSNPAWIVIDMLCRPLVEMKIIQQATEPPGYAYTESYTQNSLTYWICFNLLAVRGIAFPDDIDITKFLEWAEWCDEQVANSVGTENTTLSSGSSEGATTLNVVATTGFFTTLSGGPAQGWIVEGANIDAITWTGKTSTTLTGCSGVGQHSPGAKVYYANGTEKRCEFNGVLDSEMPLWEALNLVAQAGRAVIVINGTKYTIAYDHRETATQLFTVGNIGIDSFEVSYLSMDDRATSLELQFYNKDKDYEGDMVIIDNPSAMTVQNKVSIRVQGITSRTQAIREAYYRMNCNRTLIRSIKFLADIDAVACTIGDVIQVQHDVPEWGKGGRIEGATSTTVTLDREVALTIASSYSIMVRLASTNALVEKSIVNPNDGLPHNTFTISSAWSTVPSKFDIFHLGITTSYKSLYRVSGIKKTSDLKADITAIEYVDSIYDGDFSIVYPATHAEITYVPEIYEIYDPVFDNNRRAT